MVRELKCELLPWQEIPELVRRVAKKIKKANFKPDYIVGITRGGWIPSVLLSDELGVKNLLSLKIEHWGITARKDKKAHLTIPLNLNLSGKKILLVDDLTDTGESIQLALKHLKEQNSQEIKVATLIHKAHSKFIPDFYARKIEQWKWIILPWNIKEDLKNLMKNFPQQLNPSEKVIKLEEEFGIKVGRELLQDILKDDY